MSEIKRRDLGIAGAAVIVILAFLGFEFSRIISDQLGQLGDDVEVSEAEIEETLTQKTDLRKILKKLENMNTRLVKIDNHLILLRLFLNNRFESEENSCLDEPLDSMGGPL